MYLLLFVLLLFLLSLFFYYTQRERRHFRGVALIAFLCFCQRHSNKIGISVQCRAVQIIVAVECATFVIRYTKKQKEIKNKRSWQYNLKKKKKGKRKSIRNTINIVKHNNNNNNNNNNKELKYCYTCMSVSCSMYRE